MSTDNKSIVTSFIRDIWNQHKFENIDNYLHASFKDHSLPASLPPTKEGLKNWVISTGKSFDHITFIEDMVCEENKVMIKITMRLKHIGQWRNIEPTGAEVDTVGYRYFRLADKKITDHWALIDGSAIEHQLNKVSGGCRIQA
jgi:predicted SnoaL-like aldol condensation-catalyzing enzyme